MKLVIFVIALSITTPTFAMKRQHAGEIKSSQKKQKINDIAQAPYFDTFSFIIEQKILTLQTIIKAKGTYPKTIQTFHSFFFTTKALNTFMNNKERVADLIGEIAQQHNRSHQEVAVDLRVQITKSIYIQQEHLVASVKTMLQDPRFTLKPLNDLLEKGAQVNFTYYKNQETLLAIALKDPHRSQSRPKAINWLLENGATIGPIRRDQKCAATIALENHDLEHAEKIFAHPKFNPHHIDNDGNTLLHDCINYLFQRKKRRQSNHLASTCVYKLIKKLLSSGIDITPKNFQDITALNLAEALTYAPIIELLKNHLEGNITATSK